MKTPTPVRLQRIRGKKTESPNGLPVAIPTITIDFDQPCRKCGHKGAMASGLCIECAAKEIQAEVERPKPDHFGHDAGQGAQRYDHTRHGC